MSQFCLTTICHMALLYIMQMVTFHHRVLGFVPDDYLRFLRLFHAHHHSVIALLLICCKLFRGIIVLSRQHITASLSCLSVSLCLFDLVPGWSRGVEVKLTGHRL